MAALLLLTACGGAGSEGASAPGADTGTPADAVADSTPTDETLPGDDTSGEDSPTDGGLGAYPEGPYGTSVGSVVADLALEGYVRFDATGLASSASNGATSFGDVRAKSPRKWALIHVSGFT
jgi:hypothetical protein